MLQKNWFKWKNWMLLKVITSKYIRFVTVCFFNNGFEFQDSVCNGCHGLTMLCLYISDITIITVRGVDYHCVIHDISYSEAINLLKDCVLDDRGYI